MLGWTWGRHTEGIVERGRLSLMSVWIRFSGLDGCLRFWCLRDGRKSVESRLLLQYIIVLLIHGA